MRSRVIKVSKNQARPRLYDLTELCPAGDEEPLEGFNKYSTSPLAISKLCHSSNDEVRLKQKRLLGKKCVVSSVGLFSQKEEIVRSPE